MQSLCVARDVPACPGQPLHLIQRGIATGSQHVGRISEAQSADSCCEVGGLRLWLN
jgi:hypothetical protein